MGITKAASDVEVISTLDSHSTTSGVRATRVLDVPAETIDGDYVLVFLRGGNNTLVTPSESFTHLAGASTTTTNRISVWGKEYITGDPASYTFTRNNTGGTFSAILVVLRNAEVDVVGSLADTFTAPSINATEDGLLLALYTKNQTIILTSGPSGMDELDTTDLTLGGGNLLYGQAQTAGATGDKTVTANFNTNRSILIQFKVK